MSAIDILVIGAGVAGSSAAIRAAEAGAKVTVLDGGTGASTLAPGVMDHRDDQPIDARTDLLNIPAFDHLTMVPGTVCTTAGTVWPCYGRDRALLDVESLPGLIAVPRCEHDAWDADLFAQGWSSGSGADAFFLAIDATLLRFTDERSMPDADLAARHDDPARLSWLADRLRDALAQASEAQGGEPFAAVLLPPWLGIERPRAEELSKLVGIPCGEAVGNVGGPSGLRFERARDRAFSVANVKVQRGRAVRVEAKSDGCLVHLDNGSTVAARAVVVATGGLVGGGMTYSPSTSVVGGPMPAASRATLQATVAGDFVVGVGGKALHSPGSLFGAAPEDLAWPTATNPILERAGVLHEMNRVRTAAGEGAQLYVAGDVADDVYGSWMWAAYSGATAGSLAAAAVVKSST